MVAVVVVNYFVVAVGVATAVEETNKIANHSHRKYNKKKPRLLLLFRPLFFPVQRANFFYHYNTRDKTLLRSFEYEKDLSTLDLVWRLW